MELQDNLKEAECDPSGLLEMVANLIKNEHIREGDQALKSTGWGKRHAPRVSHRESIAPEFLIRRVQL